MDLWGFGENSSGQLGLGLIFYIHFKINFLRKRKKFEIPRKSSPSQ